MSYESFSELTKQISSGKAKTTSTQKGTDRIAAITQGISSGAIKTKAVESTYTPPAAVTTYKATYKPKIKSEEDRKNRIKEINTELGILNAQLSSPDFGITDLKEMREANKRKESLEAELKTLKAEKKYLSEENKDNFFGQFESNFDVTRLSLEVDKANNAYLDNPTKENREYADNLAKILEAYKENNKDALDDKGLIRKTLAGYLPQRIDQAVASTGGAIAGGMLGGVAGAKAGAVAGSGIYSYQTMRGSAYKSVYDALKAQGKSDSEADRIARSAANDEAVISSLIEMADTGLDIATFGNFSALKAAISGSIGKVAAKNAVAKAAVALGKYGLNIVGEGLEEAAQEAVSIANERRATSGKTDGSLAGDALKTAGKALIGKDDDARDRIKEAAVEGAKVAAVMGGIAGTVNTASEVVADRIVSNEGDKIRVDFAEDDLVAEALTYFSHKSDSYKTALAWRQEIQSGKRSDFTSLEIGTLYRQMQQDKKDGKILSSKEDEYLRKVGDRQKTLELQELAESTMDPDEKEYATAQIEHTEETVVSPTAQTLMEEGMAPDIAVDQAELIRKVTAGTDLNNKEIRALKLNDAGVRAAFTKATGVEVSDADARSAPAARKIIRSATEVMAQQKAKEAATKAQSQLKAEEYAKATMEQAVAAEEQSRQAAASETPVQAEADLFDEMRDLNRANPEAMGIYKENDGKRLSVSKAKQERRKQAAKAAKKAEKKKPIASKQEVEEQAKRLAETTADTKSAGPVAEIAGDIAVDSNQNTGEIAVNSKENSEVKAGTETKTESARPKTARERFNENISKYTSLAGYKADLDKRIATANRNYKEAEGGSVSENAKALSDLREEAIEYRNYLADARIVEPQGSLRITLQRLTNIGKKAGVKVVLSDIQDGSNGFYIASTKTLYLNANNATDQRLMTRYFVHELTHRAKDVNSDLVMGDLLDAAKAEKGEAKFNEELNDIIARYRKFYAENDWNPDSYKTANAEEDAACDFFMYAVGNRRVLDKLTNNYPKLTMRILDALSDFRRRNEKELRSDKATEKLAVRLRESLIGAQTGVTEGAGDAGKRHSIDTMVEPLGLTYEKTDKGVTIFRDANGDVVDNVTPEMVRKSALGAVIELGVKAGTITDTDMEKQVQFFSDLYNLMLETQDIDMIWAVSSAIGFEPVAPGPRDASTMDSRDSRDKFAPFTKNSDPQYSTTVDFTTICLKTKAIIDVMSETMVKLERGLTEDEIVNVVYKNVYKGGQPVPCPVCYVFSRWVGLGGLFNTMWENQKTYADLTAAKDDIARLEKAIDEVVKKHTGSDKLTGTEAKAKVYKTINARKKALEVKESLHKSGKSDTPLSVSEQNELKALTADIQILDNWSWLHNVRMQKDYKPVPADILFDINKGKEFAEQYPTAWKFRTTRGPAMGKAATPYAAEHLGQVIRGSAASDLNKAELGNQKKNPYLSLTKDGRLSANAVKNWNSARSKVKAQNLLNGQRYQSTSDFRFEYVLDYLLTFVEEQALGSKVQLYTKVPESVRMFAAVNAEVNLSLMPLGLGYDENGKLIFSSVTGMNADDAFALAAEFDNVQPIMVGTSIKHIQLCMADDRITFIIPYHASGAGEGRYKALMGIVGESVEERDDFSAYQTDHAKKDATQMQKSVYALRMKILTGKAGNLSVAEKALLGSNPTLRELWNRFYIEGVDPDCYGVKLTSSQAEHVFPFEYWDKSSTIETADEQGKAFCDYCEMLGLHPRFSGWDSKGKYDKDFDFSKDPGYWKMLIDRSMYNRDGSYHEQKAIDVTSFTKDFLFRDEAVKGLVQPSQLNDPDSVSKITDKTIADIRHSLDADHLGRRFSVDSDTTAPTFYSYMDAVNRGDMKTAQIRYSFTGVNKFGIEVYETDPEVSKMSWSDKRNQFLAIMADQYRGRTAKFIRNGHAYYAIFEDRDVGKNIYGDKRSDREGKDAKINVGASGDIFELVENSRYNGSKPEEGKTNSSHKGVLYWDYFIKKVQIDGKVFRLVVNVRKKTKQDFVYSLQLNEDKKAKAAPALASLRNGAALDGTQAAFGRTSVTQSTPVVNRRNSLDPNTAYPDGSIQKRVLDLLSTGSLEDAEAEISRWMQDVDAGKVQLSESDKAFRAGILQRKTVTPQQAAQNRAELDEMIRKTGLLSFGEKRHRPVFLPKETVENRKTSSFARTVAEAKQTPDWFVEEIERGVAKGDGGFSYIVATDKAAMKYVDAISKKSFETNLKTWEAMMLTGKGTGVRDMFSKNDIALGEWLYTEAVKMGAAGSKDGVLLATRLVAELASIGTQAGQAVQAMSLLKKMTPSGKLYYLQKTVERLNRDLEKKGVVITIDADLAREVLSAQTREDLDAAMDKLLQDIADQTPVTLMDKWNTWRYLAMLGNSRTHIRNFLSNAVFAPVTFLKDLIGIGLENAFIEDPAQRTKAMGWSEYKDFALADFENVKDQIAGTGKQNPADLIRDRRKIFKAKGLQWINTVSKKNSEWMEAEDVIFLKQHYSRALGQFLAAHNADVATLDNTAAGKNLLKKAREYAILEAQKATFRDASVLASAISRFEQTGGPAAKFVAGSLMPFKKTPINILKRGVEYSPIGLIDTVLRGTVKLKNGDISVNEYIDRISAGLTGTSIMAIGWLLAKLGLLRSTGGDDENEGAFEELQGAQNYSIVIGDMSFTIDWMAPAALPLFIGCEVFNLRNDGKDMTLGDLSDTVMSLASPLFQLSMLDGLNDTLNATKYSDDPAVVAVGKAMVTSYLGQAIPTILGQIARTIDGTRRTSYVDKNKGTLPFNSRFMQTSVLAKLPGASMTLTPKLDAWGRTDTQRNMLLGLMENAILPGYLSWKNTSAMEEELDRLYKVTGDKNVLPKAMSKYFNVNQQRYDLSADEWVIYQTVAGQTAYEMLTNLVNSPAYRSLTDAQKADAVEDIFTYAKEKGKSAAVPSYTDAPSWIGKADDMSKRGFSVDEYVVQRIYSNGTEVGSTQDVLSMSWLSDTDRANLISDSYGKKLTKNTFSDPNRSGYIYSLTEAQVEQYEQYFETQWQAEYVQLTGSTRYLNADIETRAKMIDDLKSAVADGTKKWMARQLRSDGVRSTKKD